MIAMGVGDDGAVHRRPRIHMEAAGFTIETAIGEAEELHAGICHRFDRFARDLEYRIAGASALILACPARPAWCTLRGQRRNDPERM